MDVKSRAEWKRAVEMVIDDPAASFWLQEAVRASITRDPVDALNDVEILHVLIREHVELTAIEGKAGLCVETD